MLSRNVAFIDVSDGLEFAGVWAGGMTIRDTIVINQPAGSTMFKAGSGLEIQTAVRTNINAASMDDTATLFDFAPANILRDGGMSLSGVIVNASSDAMPNFPASNVKALFKSCIGLKNTYRGGQWVVSNSTETTVSTVDTLYKIAGTTTYSDLNWFSNTTDNAMIYDGNQEIDVSICGIFSIDGGANDQISIQIRQWDDSESSYIDIGSLFQTTLNGGGSGIRGENTAFQGIATVDKNDRIEVWAKNVTDDTNFTVIEGSGIIVGERSQ